MIDQAKEVLKIEAEGILRLIPRIDGGFEDMVNLICDSPGRLIVAGIGKSGIVGRKIVATLNSTGTRSLFLHPVEAMHGDLGMVCEGDVFLALSNSGETDELNMLLPVIRKAGCKIIALTGKTDSTLARLSDVVIDVGVEREACPLGLAPTASTTAQLAMGDALAVVLINRKQFKTTDFKKFHPGGSLGQHLSNRVKEIMMTGDSLPTVPLGTTLQEAIRVMNRPELGAVLVVDQKNLCGIITDGDLRRLIASGKSTRGLMADDVMTRNPRRVDPESPAYDALNLMEKHQITLLPVTDSQNEIKGIVHLHDVLGKGEFKINGK